MRYVFSNIEKQKEDNGNVLEFNDLSCMFSYVIAIDTTRDLIEYPWSVFDILWFLLSMA